MSTGLYYVQIHIINTHNIFAISQQVHFGAAEPHS